MVCYILIQVLNGLLANVVKTNAVHEKNEETVITNMATQIGVWEAEIPHF